MLVVTGPGHSGTAWLALALSFAGLPTTHEGVYTLTAPPKSWPPGLAADVSLAALPHVGCATELDALVVVRDPRLIARSFWRGRTFAASCPCHPPGAHRGSPFARWADVHYDLDADEREATIGYVVQAFAIASKCLRPVVQVEDRSALVDALRNHVMPARMTKVFSGPWLPDTVNAHGVEGPEREPLDDARLDELAVDFGYPR